MEETTPFASAQCPHCRRMVALDEVRTREGAVFECSWRDCGRQVMRRRDELVSPSNLLRTFFGALPKPKG